jgi:predicted XRE-type DNA-binding protein
MRGWRNENKIMNGDVDNIFAEMGLSNAGEELAKVDMSQMIRLRIEELGLTQNEAAARIGTDQAKVSQMVRGRVRSYTIDRLTRYLVRLGVRVEIRMIPEDRSVQRAEMIAVGV